MPPRLGEVRTALASNGFECARKRKHEIWVRRDAHGNLEAKVIVSRGNAEIRTRGLFTAILRQAKKSEDEFYKALR